MTLKSMTLKESIGIYISLNDLDTPARHRNKAYTRIILYNYLRNNSTYSFKEIGDMFNRHHSAVLHGSKAYDQLKNYSDFIELEKEVLGSIELDNIDKDLKVFEKIVLSDKNLADLIVKCDSYHKYQSLRQKVIIAVKTLKNKNDEQEQ
jgi:hypothetical protein